LNHKILTCPLQQQITLSSNHKILMCPLQQHMTLRVRTWLIQAKNLILCFEVKQDFN
jgi:hypothetical protein